MPLITDPLTIIGRDDFTGLSGNLDAHTPVCVGQGLPVGCGIVGWEYGISTDWQLEFNAAVSKTVASVFCRNTVDLIPSLGPLRLYAFQFRGGVDNTGWAGGIHFFADSVGSSSSTVQTGILYVIRRLSANTGAVELLRYNDAGVIQENILVQSDFSHPLVTGTFYGVDIAADNKTITCWHAASEAQINGAGPTVFGDFVLTQNIRDASHLRVGIGAGAGGTSGRNFTGIYTLLKITPTVIKDPIVGDRLVSRAGRRAAVI